VLYSQTLKHYSALVWEGHAWLPPGQLGHAPFELGTITGTRSINLLLSLLLTGPNDGKVTVESAQLQGMKAFLTVPVSHPFIMQNHAVMA